MKISTVREAVGWAVALAGIAGTILNALAALRGSEAEMRCVQAFVEHVAQENIPSYSPVSVPR